MAKPPKKPRTGPAYATDETGVPILTWIDPLAWPEVDPKIAKARRLILDETSALRFFCTPGTKADLEDIVERYRQINDEEKDGPLVAPGMNQILEKMVWPLRNAKANFAAGNYLATIALCGIVTEMVALLIFEVADPQFNGTPLDGQAQERLFGRKFEDLEQSRREAVLFGLGLISLDQKSHFGKVREIRRKHLHLFDYDPEEAREDARTIYNRAYMLFFSVGPVDPEKYWELTPGFQRYLKKHGIPGPFPPPPPTTWRKLGPDGEVIAEMVASFNPVKRRKKP